jgi:hypothetical protein
LIMSTIFQRKNRLMFGAKLPEDFMGWSRM